MRTRLAVIVLIATAAAALGWQARTHSQAPAFDLVIRGGRIVDGTGSPWFVADVGIKGDTITAIRPRLDAGGARVVNAQGLVVSPSFVDVHAHVEPREGGEDMVGNPATENNVRQGVTTVIRSPDGGGPVAPARHPAADHFERGEQVLRVEPPTDGHHGGLDVFQVGPNVARLPKLVVRPVSHHLLPERDLVLEILLVRVGQRSQSPEELVAVRRIVVENELELLRRLGSGPAKTGHEVEGVRQEKRPIVVPVVPDEPVGHWCLRRCRHQRGVSVDHTGGCVEARVGNAPHPDLAVVAVTWPALLALLALAVLCTVLAYFIYFRLIANIGSTKTSTVTFLIPLFGIFWAAVFLQEPENVGVLAGLGVILLSVRLVLGNPRKRLHVQKRDR